MPDITKCTGINCSMRNICYRHYAEDSLWQSWADLWKECDKDSNYKHFWGRSKEDRILKKLKMKGEI